MQTKTYDLRNLDCASCATKIEASLNKNIAVENVSVNFATSTIDITCHEQFNVKDAIQSIEPDVFLVDASSKNVENKIIDKKLAKLFIASAIWLIGLIYHESIHKLLYREIYEIIIYGIPYLLVGWDILFGAYKKIQRGQWMDEEILMSLATIGAIAIHELPEAIGVMLFYSLGEYLQERAVASSRGSINSLLTMQSEVAHLVNEEQVIDVNPKTIQIEEEIIVYVGEQIPLDGKVLKGISSLNTSALTGEFMPSEIRPGKLVYAGMINLQETLRIQVSAIYENSSIAKMVKIVQQASSRKAKVEKFMTQFSRYYTPIVVFLAALVALIPPLIFQDATFQEWIYRALSLLVISCPCALMISIPLGYFGGLGALSKKGILVKGADNINVLAKIETIVFDKTGTLTKGEFKISKIYPEEQWTKEQLLDYALIAEYQSSHPIAVAIKRELKNKEINLNLFESTKEISGKGVQVRYNNEDILAGNLAFLISEKISLPTFSETIIENILYLSINGNFAGRIVIDDEIKKQTSKVIETLRTIGVQKMIMLTGDRTIVAEKISETLGLDSYQAELFPEEKLNALEKILATNSNPVAFLGDGINDAPALARADVGISMGEAGADIAIESADVVLLTDNLQRLPEAILISRFTRKIVWQNIVFTLTAKLVFIVLGILGITGMWWAVIADVGVSLIAVLNAMRIVRK